MPVITRSNHPSDLWPGIMAHFGKTYKEMETQYSKIFEDKTSDKAYEELVESTTFGLAVQKTEGGAITYDTDGEGYKTRLTNVVYGLGYMVTREEREDGQYESKSKKRSRALAYSMKQTKELIHAAIFNNAFTAGATAGGDGAALCSTAHPTLAGNKANKPAVDADLSEAALEDETINIRLMTNSRGLKHYFRPKKLIVPPQLLYVAERLMTSEKRPGTADNDPNAIKSTGAISGGYMVYDYLTDPDAWFMQIDVPEGLVTMQRRAIEFTDDSDFDTENAKAKSTERYIPGWGDWRGVWGSAGA
jgi:hypothetical protein